ncbi:MAG: N-acetylglucosamine-6-phosphate deacetylase [Clostridia bacterium]|nr:N-acetylglucosamine-6-phosphate deacetylase [Clostridia bacterium]
MNAIINGAIILPDTVVEGCALLYENNVILGVVHTDDVPADATIIDAGGGYVMPGLIDLHIHGYGGVDVCDGNPDALRQMDEMLLKNGVTGWLATTMTTDEETLRIAFESCREVMAEGGHALLGVHAEGPYINPNKAGAQDVANVIPPHPALIKEYADVIRLLTLAPEMDADFATIRALKQDTDIVLAMGHTNADYDTAMAAVEAGITHTTHLFNAMSPLHHREPGAVGAALTADVSCELIADNHHIHPALYEMVWRQKTWNVCLVTDCLSAAGTPDGKGMLGGQPIAVQNGVCVLPDGTLAGSTLHLWEAVRNLHAHTTIPLWECVNCATLNPADVLGLEGKGSLEAGNDADILITDRDFYPQTTIFGGKIV